MAVAPNRQTSEASLDQWNNALRASPAYQKFIQQRGLVGKAGGWSKSDQAALEQTLRSSGIPIPDGMHIDQGGNLNQKNRLGRNVAIGAGITAAAVATAGVAGFGPLAGAMGGGAGAGGVAGSVAGIDSTIAGMGAGGWATGTTMAATAPSLASTLLRYGFEYGLPTVGGLINSRNQSNANRDAAQIEADYNNRALDAALEEQKYRRGVDEENQRYTRGFNEEARGYDRAKYAESTNHGRRNYGNFVETLEPYRASGTAATQYASRLLGLNVPEYSGGTYYDLARDARTPVSIGGGQTPDAAARQPVSTTMPVGGGGGQMVRLRAPNGEEQDVLANQVWYYEQRGATRA